MGNVDRPRIEGEQSETVSQLKNLKLMKPSLIKGLLAHLPTFCHQCRKRRVLFLAPWTSNILPFVLKEDITSVFQDGFLCKNPRKDSPEQKLSIVLLRDMQKPPKFMENCLPTNINCFIYSLCYCLTKESILPTSLKGQKGIEKCQSFLRKCVHIHFTKNT